MNIIDGKLYYNRTLKYLFPCLKYYGKQYIEKISSVCKLAVGIRDFITTHELEPCIYVLIGTRIPTYTPEKNDEYAKTVEEVLEWFRDQPFFVADYPYDISSTCCKHMLVLKIPRIHEDAYYNFIEGKYSKMYNVHQVNEYFKKVILANKTLENKVNERTELSRRILLKDPTYLQTFTNIVNKEFNTKVTAEDLKGTELDLPFKPEEETFSYELQI